MSISIQDIDKGWKKITEEIRRFKKAYVKVGVLSDAGSYPESGNVNLASVATFLEFGTSKMVARPFMKQTYDKNQSAVQQLIKTQYLAISGGIQTVEKAMNTLGVFFKGKIQAEIGSGDFAPTKRSTNLRKNFKSKSFRSKFKRSAITVKKAHVLASKKNVFTGSERRRLIDIKIKAVKHRQGRDDLTGKNLQARRESRLNKLQQREAKIKSKRDSRVAAVYGKKSVQDAMKLQETGGKSTPLIDTGRLRQSINYEIVY